MERRRGKIIVAALVAILILIQLIHPVFNGDVLLSIPERIRTAFTQLFDWHEEDEEEDQGGLKKQLDSEKAYTLEQGNDTPMQVFDEEDEVDLPPEENNNNSSGETISPGENELPIDDFGG